LGSDRQLLMLPTLNFPSTFTTATFKSAGPSINVGVLQAKRFYIAMEDGKLRGYNEGDWQQRGKSGILSLALASAATWVAAIKAQLSSAYYAIVPEGVTKQIKGFLLSGTKDYWASPYESTVAKVRVSNTISDQEQAAVAKRMQVNRTALESKIGKINRPLKVAMVCSGGGYRAMIFTLGVLTGAQKAGLLDMVTWITALSGSTWALGSWLENSAKLGADSPSQFRLKLFTMLKDKALQDGLTSADFDRMSNLFQTDIAYGKPMTLVNIYGALLANRLFDNFGAQKQTLKLSDQQTIASAGNFPIPIYTAVSGEENQPEYYWYAFTPWEVSMEPWTKGGIGISVPAWGYGRKYRNGQSTEYMPEQSLGFQLGTFGSAFAADVETLYNTLAKGFTNPTVHKMVDAVLLAHVGNKRLSWASVPNFGRGVPQSPLRANDALQLVDGAFGFNLPYPPVSSMRADRSADVIIFVDAFIRPDELKKVEAYAQKKGLKFPKIDYTLIGKNAVTIHQNPSDPSVPLVIYISFLNDANQAALLNNPALQPYKATLAGFDAKTCFDGVCTTLNFKYTYDDMIKLSALGEFNLLAYISEIFIAIKSYAKMIK